MVKRLSGNRTQVVQNADIRSNAPQTQDDKTPQIYPDCGPDFLHNQRTRRWPRPPPAAKPAVGLDGHPTCGSRSRTTLLALAVSWEIKAEYCNVNFKSRVERIGTPSAFTITIPDTPL